MNYLITETIPATQTWVYEIEASSEEEALNKVTNNEIEPLYSYTEVDEDGISSYEVNGNKSL